MTDFTTDTYGQTWHGDRTDGIAVMMDRVPRCAFLKFEECEKGVNVINGYKQVHTYHREKDGMLTYDGKKFSLK